jgi:hypothetical protein
MKRFHFIYKTVNTVNKKYYIGVHSTNDLNDGYLGSGTQLRRAVKKYGRENFERVIIACYDNREEALLGEQEIVNEEVINDTMSYNISLGGYSVPKGRYGYANTVAVKDSEGVLHNVLPNDVRYISDELVHYNTNKVAVKDKNNNVFSVSTDDPRFISGELVALSKGTVMVRGSDGRCFRVSKDDPRYLSGELKGSTYNMVCVYDITDPERKGFAVSKDDPRYISGQLVAKSKGRKCKDHVKDVKSKLNKDKIWVNKDGKGSMIHYSLLSDYIKDGWSRGRRKIKS